MASSSNFGPADHPRPDDGDGPVRPASGHGVVFRRMGRNLGWLLGGRGFHGITSLIYLAAAARGLGVEGFGVFTLVLAYGQAIASLAQFQSWHAVIRYGAIHLAQDRRDRLAHLLGFTVTLDIASALAGALAALLGTALVGPWLAWDDAIDTRAALFGAVLLLSTGATANGVLRLRDRFDLVAYTEAVGPGVRLIGAVAAWAAGGGLDAFLIAWAAAAAAQSAAQWIVALRLDGIRFALGRRAFRDALAENVGLWRFMWQTSLSASLGAVWQQLGTLAVGNAAGAAAAGGYRLASRLAKALTKPVQSIARVLYPELARLRAGEDGRTLKAVMKRIGLVGIGTGAALIVIAVLLGRPVLHLFGGQQFVFAHTYLILFAIAAAIDLSGFALESLLHAHGRAGRVLGTRIVAAGVYMLALAVLLPAFGTVGAVVASIASALVIRIGLGITARQLLRRRTPAAG